MEERPPVTRRRFILISALSTAAAGLGAACARFQPSSALTPEERRIVEALADQVIPPDDTPGGKEAGVAEFIDWQLRGPYRRHRAVYRAGLARIDETSRRVAGAPFAELPFERQTALLEALEAGSPEGLPHIWEPGEGARVLPARRRALPAGVLREPAPRRQPQSCELEDARPLPRRPRSSGAS